MVHIYNGILLSYQKERILNVCCNMDHSFLIQSSVEGHLGSFHDLAIVDNAAMNIGVHMALLFTTSVSLG